MELPPHDSMTAEDRAIYFSEDLLWLADTTPHEGGFRSTDVDGLTVDLGWYGPPGSGFYRLSVLRGSWEDVSITVESPDQYFIRDCIDDILESIAEGIPLETIAVEIAKIQGS